MRFSRGTASLLVVILALMAGAAGAAEKPAAKQKPPALAVADGLFAQQNWKDAANAYRQFLAKPGDADDLWDASVQLSLCMLRLQEYDKAIEAAQEMVARFKGTIREPRAERVLGNLYLTVPHWGTEKGGKLLRGRYDQGIRKYTYTLDRKKAVEHLERARDLYIALAANPARIKGLDSQGAANLWKERIEAQFDLAAAISRFGPYDQSWGYWWYAWGTEADENEDDTVGETPYRGRGGYYGLQQRGRPNGIPVDAEGKPIWDPVPDAYSPALPPGQKLKFLLHEIEKLDKGATKEYSALAVYRRAMLARARYGADRLQQVSNWWDGGNRPYAGQVEKRHLYELADNEVLTLLGTRLTVVQLPADEDITGLLRTVVAKYPKTDTAGEAQYALGMYFQSREQYNKALDEYAHYRDAFPKGKRIAAITDQENSIRRPEVAIDQLGVQLAGDKATLPVTYRNTKTIHFKAYTLDLGRYLDDVMDGMRKDQTGDYWYYNVQNLSYALLQDRGNNKGPRYKDYLGALVAEWDAPVEDDNSHRYAKARIATPLQDRGCRLIEASVPGGTPSRNLLLLQDLAVVEKNYKGQLLHYVCDARTGAPAPEAKLHYFQFWQKWEKKGDDKTQRQHWYVSERDQAANDGGISLFEPETRDQMGRPQVITIARSGERMAFAGVQYWSYYYRETRQWQGQRGILFTDRPVYRPGQTVHLKLWVRRYENGVYQQAGRENISTTVRDPKNKVVVEQQVPLDGFGGGSFDLKLEDDAPLGIYTLYVPGVDMAGGAFRVEEYKKPEYEVTVEPATDLAKLGDKVSGVIRAKYYFGAPVTNATVKYRIYREDYTFTYTEPGAWDWLYGAGYGRCYYDYDWFPWWGRYSCKGCVWYPWWGAPPQPERELVGEGESQIGDDGTVKFEIDTAPAKEAFPDKDHLYTIEAEVRDASRRVITGTGQVKVTRQEYYTFVEVDRGYYQPGQQLMATVRTLTPSGTPISVKGQVVISAIRYAGPGNAQILEEPEQKWDAQTDADGKLVLNVKVTKSGQFKVAFESKDSKGEPVAGAAVAWVAGGDFDGKVYRFADLEILTDKRTYAPGEVAHVMLNCAREGATVLFSHHMDGGALVNYQLIPVPNRSRVVDVPIARGDVPNFFIEATVVFDGKVHQDAREICVPPTAGMVNLQVACDQGEYRPGAKGTIVIKATTPDGKPVRTQVALAAFDRSVLFIQPELTPDIRAQFWGQKRYYSPQLDCNLQQSFTGTSELDDPHGRYWGDYAPQDWYGSWGGGWIDWATADKAALRGALRDGYAADRLEQKASNAVAAASAAAPPAPGAAGGAGAKRGRELQAGERQDEARRKAPGEPGGEGEGPMQEAQVRSQFADTALWLASVETNDKGEATAEVTLPENLTTWKVRALGMTENVRVGDASTSMVTTKNLIVRLQAPRFFMERDRVTLTANVHNYLKTAKRAKVTLAAGEGPLEVLGSKTTTVTVPAGGEATVNWEVAVKREGSAVVKVEALTDEESDAMQMTFPALVHGIERTVATTGSMKRGGSGVTEVPIEIPAQRNPLASKLEVRFSPSLAAAIIDSLPYLLEYPYGCTEQTMSRFLPAVLVQRSLQKMGLKLEDLQKQRANLNAQEIGGTPGRPEGWQHDPVFSTREMDKIVAEGLERLYSFQQPDGGWGWWANDRSSSYLTAYVTWGLALATEAGVPVDQNVLQRGIQALRSNVQSDLATWKEQKYAGNDQAFVAYVLALQSKGRPANNAGVKALDDLQALLFDRRAQLSNYGKALLSLSLRDRQQVQKADLVLQNIRQFEKQDDENETTWFETSQNGWWHWWNNDIETNAWVLKALIAKDPKDPAAPRLVKWLLNHRQHGYYWRSTRDTAVCATSFLDYMRAVGEDRPNYTVKLLYDGKPVKQVKITPENFLSCDNRLTLEGDRLTSGRHTLRLERSGGDGPLYFNTYLSYFTKEEDIRSAGLELKVEREYYKLERQDRTVTIAGSRLQDVQETQVRYKRIPLKEGDTLKSGDLVEVELRLTSKNDYDYLCFEDMKAAGFEPVEVRSGTRFGELCSNMELRDQRVVFFVNELTQGDHLIRYRMRAEIPGTFHALPTKAWAMYAPELKANSSEMVIKVTDTN